MAPTSRAGAARLVGVVVSALVLVGTALGTAPAARAASRTVADETGDVYSLTGDTPTRVSGPDGDIVSVTTVHTDASIRIKIRAQHLSVTQTLLFAKVRTSPTGPAYFFSGTADIGMRMAVMTRGQAHVIVCRGLWMRFRPSQGSVTAVIPRRCLGDPRWVRAGAALATTDSLIATLADDDVDPLAEDADGPGGTIDIAGVGGVTAAQRNAGLPPLPLGPRVSVG